MVEALLHETGSMNRSADNFLKSINLRMDLDHPERFEHFQPTKKSLGVIQAVFNSQPSSASIVVATYGSGKSLIAGIASLLVGNMNHSRHVLARIRSQFARVDRRFSKSIEERLNSSSRGMAIVLEGHQTDPAETILEQAKKSLKGLRGPAKSRRTVVNVLDAIQQKANAQQMDRISIVWDEFGRHLETLASSGQAELLSEVQQIAEWSARQSNPAASFMLLLHQNFSHYAGDLSQTARSSWRKIAGRFTTVEYVEDSKEMYQFIGATIVKLRPRQKMPTMRQFEREASKALELGLFDSFKSSKLLAKTLQDAYPVRSVALHSLPKLASRLAQNERTALSFIHDADLRQERTLTSVYEYFSPYMKTDSGIGGTQRRWLETESALSKAVNGQEREVLTTAAMLALGISGERMRVRKKLLLFAVTGVAGLTGRTAEKTIDGLIQRKLLLYRQRNDDISVWHGTDIDIRSHLEEERLKIGADLDILSELCKEHPPPYVRPIVHNIKHSVRRFFSGMYVWGDELLDKGNLHPVLSVQLERKWMNLILSSRNSRMHSVSGRSDRTGISVIELFDMLSDEDSTRKWFEETRWPDERFFGHCGSVNTKQTKNHKLMPCWCVDCRSFFSVRTETVMHTIRLLLRKWIVAMYLMMTSLKCILSTTQLRDLGITQNIAWYNTDYRLRVRKFNFGSDNSIQPSVSNSIEVPVAIRCRCRADQPSVNCGCQVSPIAGTDLEQTRLPLPKWFAAIYLTGADKGEIFTRRFSKMVGVFWPTAYRMLRNLRQSMSDLYSGYWFEHEGLVVDDAFIWGRKSAKRGREVACKKQVNFAREQQKNSKGFMAAWLVERVNLEQIREFVQHILPYLKVRKNTFNALRFFWESHLLEPRLLRRNKWMNGFRRFILSSAISRVFWQKLSTRYCINTYKNILTSLCSASIANVGNLSSRTEYRKPSLNMCRFRFFIQFRRM